MSMPMSNSRVDPKPEFERMVRQYVSMNAVGPDENRSAELEVRFGAHSGAKMLTRTDYDRTVARLLGAGFVAHQAQGEHFLRMNNEYVSADGKHISSNIRVEIPGLDLIQKYCKTNSLIQLLRPETGAPDVLSANKITFMRKLRAKAADTNEFMRPVNFGDFNFKVALSEEQKIGIATPDAQKVIKEWESSKRIFRLMNRVRFVHPTIPVFADLSLVRSSPTTTVDFRRIPIAHFTMQDAHLLHNTEAVEIELEVDNARTGNGTPFDTPNAVLTALRGCIRTVLGALRQTVYPISNTESAAILAEYAAIVFRENAPTYMTGRNFIGPSPVTLQMENLVDTNTPGAICVRENYTVTEKVDGERRLLFISSIGKIYMITPAMLVIFTGIGSSNPECFGSVLDGEFVSMNTRGEPISLFMAFDVYVHHGRDVRAARLAPPVLSELPVASDSKKAPDISRLEILHSIVSSLRIINATAPSFESDVAAMQRAPGGGKSAWIKENRARAALCNFRVAEKTFYQTSPEMEGVPAVSIFDACARVLDAERNKLFEYTIDGLIFTPADIGVGGNVPGEASDLVRITWPRALKWKPPEFNTVDFLVKIKKNAAGQDEVLNLHQDGTNLAGGASVVQYKTLILHCGFSTGKGKGHVNPFEALVNGEIPTSNAGIGPNSAHTDSAAAYVAIPFQAIMPYDAEAYICKLQLRAVPGTPATQTALLTEEHEPFGEFTVVEFRYDLTAEHDWRWKPIRVRHDKTSEMKAGVATNFGNNYEVANSNWTSIHLPISRDAICGRADIALSAGAIGDIYYNRAYRSELMRGMRDFHNRFVKRILIMRTARRGNTLIDYAVGKAGDLNKWIDAKLGFVFGIDVARDNIENKFDGACRRYLEVRSNAPPGRQIPAAMFVAGNSALNIRTGDAFAGYSDRNAHITRAIFGEGPKDAVLLGKGVYDCYGAASLQRDGGFDISSIQFSLHYFFENKTVLHNFVRNIAECTKVGGMVIGTCFDGSSIFRLLSQKPKGGSVAFFEDTKLMVKITKQYAQTGFPSSDEGLGYAVDVYQESINQTLREYLVNHEYFVSVMFDYGLDLLPAAEAAAIGFSRGATGLFSDLWSEMKMMDASHSRSFGAAEEMTESEKAVSFLNRYFVFKKRANVDAAQICAIALGLAVKLEPGTVDSDSPISGRAIAEKPSDEPKHQIRSVLQSVERERLIQKLRTHDAESAKQWTPEHLRKLEDFPGDLEAYDYLRKMSSQDNSMESDARAAALADNLLNMIPAELKGAAPFSGLYLDYGCASGTITRHVATSLNIPAERVVGADIVDTGFAARNAEYTFVHIVENSDSPLRSIADKTVDLITVSMVLHHVADLPVVLREFARVLSPTGVIVVREHDCTTPAFAEFLDVLHGLYSLVWTEPPEDPTFLETYSAHYRAETEWSAAFAEHGFARTARKYTVSKRAAGQYVNVTRAFYAVFQRASAAI